MGCRRESLMSSGKRSPRRSPRQQPRPSKGILDDTAQSGYQSPGSPTGSSTTSTAPYHQGVRRPFESSFASSVRPWPLLPWHKWILGSSPWNLSRQGGDGTSSLCTLRLRRQWNQTLAAAPSSPCHVKMMLIFKGRTGQVSVRPVRFCMRQALAASRADASDAAEAVRGGRRRVL